jgi:rhodanese-related sulfurtransferase
MKRKMLFGVALVLVALMIVFTGCAKKEAAAPAPAPVVAAAPAVVAPAPAPAVVAAPAVVMPAPAPVAPAIDKTAVLLKAAKAYFPLVTQSNNMIASKDVKALLTDNPEAVFILDIRSAVDFEAGHIPGANHSEWAKVGEIMEKIPQNRQVVVTCYSGQTAGQTVGALRLAGFTNVKSLSSGMKNGWVPAGFTAEETGMKAAASLNNVSAPKDEEQKVLWDAAKAYFQSVAKDGNKLIAAQALYDALQANPKAFTVIDIRSKEDFDKGHIEFATHSLWAQFGNLLDTLPKTGKIVVACYSGQTAGQTVGVLRTLGYDAYSLTSGYNGGWIAASLPLVQ